MTTATSPAPSHSPPPSGGSHSASASRLTPGANGARGPQGGSREVPDAFAILLSLAAEASGPADAGLPGAETGIETDTRALADTPVPAGDAALASLLGWALPRGPAQQAGQGTAALDGTTELTTGLVGETRRQDLRGGTQTDTMTGTDAAPVPARDRAGRGLALGAGWQMLNPRAGGAITAPLAGEAALTGRWRNADPAPLAGAAAGTPAGAAPAVRSTVTLDGRFTHAQAPQEDRDGEPAAPAGLAALARASTSTATGASTGGAGGDSGAPGGDATGERGASGTTEAGTAPEHTGAPDAFATAADETAEVQHWGAPGLRHATLRVGEAGENAVDIQLALRGDEVHLSLRTGDEAVREALTEQARQALGERLAQDGLQLGQVSVGGHGPGSGTGGEQRGHAGASPATTRARDPQHAAPETAATAAIRRSGGGAGAVDLFV